MTTDLIRVGEIDPAEFFSSDGGVLPLLDKIKAQAEKLVFDIETDAGLKDCKRAAREVSSIKAAIDTKGKDHLARLKEQCKPIDAQRKIWRDEMDKVRDQILAPVIEKEKAEQAKLDELRRQEEAEAEQRRLDLERREREAAEREREIERKEREAAAKIEAERMAQLRAEQARKDAENAAARAVQEAQEQAARAERERLGAIQQQREAAERAERDRIEAERRAVERQAEAERQARAQAEREAQERDRQRLAAEQAERDRLARLAADKANRDRVMAEIYADLEPLVEWSSTDTVCEAIKDGKIRHLKIDWE